MATMLMGAAPQAKKSAVASRGAKKNPATALAPGEKSGLNKKHLETYVRHLYVWGPQIKLEIGDFFPSPVPGLLQTTIRASAGLASEDKVFYVSKDGKEILSGDVFPAADNPFRSNLSKITTALQPSFGTPGATVVIVVYSDFQCPHCRDEAKALRENILRDYPKSARVYFKDFPLAMHDWAKTASMVGRCIFRQNPLAFWNFHDWAFEHQAEITAVNFRDKLSEFIRGKEIDPLQLTRCLDKRETEAEVDKSIAEGKSLGINSTPTSFVNGRRLAGATPWVTLKQIIDFEIDYQKTAKNAGEDCGCEVRLPAPLSN